MSQCRDIGPGDEDSDGEFSVPPAPLPAAALPAFAASGQATPAASVQLAPAAGSGELAASAGLAGGSEAASEGLPATTPAAAVTAAEWMEWLQQRRVGLRRPIGMDFRGRRYW